MNDERQHSQWVEDDFQKTDEGGQRVYETEASSPDKAASAPHSEAHNGKEQNPFFGRRREARSQEKKSGEGKGRARSFWLILIAALLAAFLLAQSFYVVPEGQIGVISQFGKIVKTTEKTGLHVHLPFVQSVSYLTSRMLFYDVSPSEVLTADKKAMIVDSYALWRISDPTLFIRSVGSISETEKRIDATVYSNIKNIMGRLQQSEIISDEQGARENLNDQVTTRAGEELKGYGVEMLRVEIRRYDLPQDNLDAVYQRMISERQQMAASIKAEGEYQAAKIKNGADKEVGIRVGKAEADAKKIAGEAEQAYMNIMEAFYSNEEQADFYRFMLELDAYREALQGKKTLVLGPDSPLGRFLRGSQPEAEKDAGH